MSNENLVPAEWSRAGVRGGIEICDLQERPGKRGEGATDWLQHRLPFCIYRFQGGKVGRENQRRRRRLEAAFKAVYSGVCRWFLALGILK